MELRNEIFISNLINKLKKSGKKVFSNSYMRFADGGRTWNVSFSRQSVLILNVDQGVNRLLFYTTDFEDFEELLRTSMDGEKEYVIEIVTKDRDLYREELRRAGFSMLAAMRRVSVKDISPLFMDTNNISAMVDESLPVMAEPGDADLLAHKLWDIFDTRISHLPDREEICRSIENGEFCIYRDEDLQVRAFLQSVTAPKSFYINQVYNSVGKEAIHSIMYTRLRQYYLNGGRYVYAWVDETNIASLKFHAKYGLQPDGLYTCVYSNQIKNRNKVNVKTILFLHLLLMVFSALGVFSKIAAAQPFLSFEFILFYGIVILNLGIYAVCWQQIIKRMPLVVAFANKAVTVVWGIVWGRVFFGESVSMAKIIGAAVIICGILLVVTEKEERHG